MDSLYHSLTIGSLNLNGNLFLAPVAGYTDRAFRSICVEEGADFTFTELASSEAIVRGGGEATMNLVRRAPNESCYAVQLFGANPDVMYRAALALAPFKPDAVDINAGCPVPKVVKTGAGSALMKDPARLAAVVAAVVRASEEALGGAPVTIKTRLGWDAASLNYEECARTAVGEGAAMVSLHARTRAQGYSGEADWRHIGELAARLPVPVAGSGDLYTPEDAERMLRETSCAAVMFARGAMGNPFIFRTTKRYLATGAWEAPSYAERFAAAFRQLDMLAADIGENAACREMRKTFAAYTKGFPGGNRLRDALVRASTIAEFHSILERDE